ncbi:Fic family protein [Microbacterium karelineae]|uniref:Fic family protein n=1 Tax=Microbacterium karelineae TaxID=2654283 RepID=UPI001E386D14|nr:Fic family protein [Microbacterium karelineae]
MTDLMASIDGGAPLAVSPTGREAREWRPVDTGEHSRAELRRQTGTYEATVPATIADVAVDLTGADVADIEDATRALVAFDSYARAELGADSPVLAPMAAILLRSESASSSQIEQLTSSARQIALAEIGEGDKRNAETIVGNVRAMEAALRLSGRVDAPSILSMHRELLSRQSGMEDEAGRWRRDVVWIGAGNAGPVTADFVGPVPERIADAIDDAVRFAAREDLPVLAQAAIVHAQFETIHPFADGNGRTGRALAHAILRGKGLVTSTTVPISAGLLTDLDAYFAALVAYQGGDAGPIVRRFSQASRAAAVVGRDLVDALAGELREARAKMSGVRADAGAWRVLPLLVQQPVLNSRAVRERLGMGEVAAKRALDTLVERGVLVERTGSARNRIWQHRGILGALDGYADRVRRARGA